MIFVSLPCHFFNATIVYNVPEAVLVIASE